MKLKSLATTTTALLAASLMGYAETHDGPGARAEPGQPGQAAAAERHSAKEIAAQVEKWEDAERSKVELEDIPERARNGIRSAAGEDEIEETAELSADGEKLFVAKISGEDADRLIFVKDDATLTASLHETEFSSAPQAVQAAVDGEPEEFHRISVDGESHFIAKVKDDDKTTMVLISNTGEKTELKSKQKDDD